MLVFGGELSVPATGSAGDRGPAKMHPRAVAVGGADPEPSPTPQAQPQQQAQAQHLDVISRLSEQEQRLLEQRLNKPKATIVKPRPPPSVTIDPEKIVKSESNEEDDEGDGMDVEMVEDPQSKDEDSEDDEM